MASEFEAQVQGFLRGAAKAYGEKGIKIFPLYGVVNGKCECRDGEGCKNPGKHPRVKNWQEAASADAAQIEAWWGKWSNSNIGVPTGHLNNLVVADIDPRHGGEKTLQDLEQQIPEFKLTKTVATGGGGCHKYFLANGTSVKNKSNLSIFDGRKQTGLDIRGDGGYVVGSPSMHVSGKRYTVETPLEGGAEILVVPEKLLQLIEGKMINTDDHSEEYADEETDSDDGREALDGSIIREGERNDKLYRIACALRAKGNNLEQILSKLREINRARVQPPLDDDELEGIAGSAVGHRPSIFGSVRIVDGYYVRIRQVKDDIEEVRLSNFTAKITRVVQLRGGPLPMTQFEIQVTLETGEELEPCLVPVEEFASMGWLIQNFGNRAQLSYGASTKDMVRAAIQFFSHPTQEFFHLRCGWEKIGNQEHYLHAGGAIPNLPIAHKSYFEQGGLTNYNLLLPGSLEVSASAVRRSLEMEKLTAGSLGTLLISAVYGAPLIGRGVNGDFTIALVGASGTHKSSCAGVAQGHYGAGFSRLHLQSWFSTTNYLEGFLYLTQNALTVVDDFAPTGSNREVDSLHSKAERIIRAVGNRSSRGRMSATRSLERELSPSCMLLITGEDVPRGHSLRSRMLIEELERGEVDLKLLSELQKDSSAGTLSMATAGYIQYLAKSIDQVKAAAEEKLPTFRQMFQDATNGAHARVPEILAQLYFALDVFCDFCVSLRVFDDNEALSFRTRSYKNLILLAHKQNQITAEESPADKFIGLLRGAITTGRVHFAKLDGSKPEGAERWGWRPNADGEFQPSGDKIGWVDISKGELILDPQAAIGAVARYAREQGDHLANTKGTIQKRLSEAKYTVKNDEKNTVKRTVEGARRACLVIKLEIFDELLES